MADSLLFGKRAKGSITIGSDGSISIDCRTSEKHSFSSKTTDYPVENGSSMTDHVIANPYQIGVDGIVSNTPLDETESFTGNGTRRSDEAYELLVNAVDNGTSVVLSTSLAVYIGIITQFDSTKDVSSGEGLPFSITFREVLKGKVKLGDPVALDKIKGADTPAGNASAGTGDRTESKKDAGRKQMTVWEEANFLADQQIKADKLSEANR